MARRILNTLIIIPLVMSIAFTSSGLTFFLHHCHCDNTLYVSISEKIVCEAEHQHALCSSVEDDNVMRIEFEAESCGCTNEYITLKLVDANVFSAFIHLDFVQPVTIFDNANSRQLVDEPDVLTSNNSSPPPLIWGRRLVMLYQCPKTPESIIA